MGNAWGSFAGDQGGLDAAINHPNVGIGGACLFRDFVQTYNRDVLPTLASTSRQRSLSVLKNYLIPEFGDLMLRKEEVMSAIIFVSYVEC